MKMRYRAGDALFREGDPGDFACLILEGSFEVRHDAGGDSVVLGELGPGDLTGEMGVLENLPRSATVAARTDACVEVIPAEAFADWIAARPDAAWIALQIGDALD
ncbi:MAG TPA: cyclic nucleotide-binding domain-containing protein, partial [Azospirillaceae bacterium]|nr:cyclic nucleotide-binding domain-containing protein [Azospirillaceae bacterium]